MQSISTFSDVRVPMPIPSENVAKLQDKGLFQSSDRKTQTVLIVEDNDVVSDFLQCAFNAYGYRTLLATTPEEAIEHCRRDPDAIHALIADVKLGRFDGFQTACTLRRMCPEMKIVMTSGYPLDHLVRAGLMPADLGHTVFVQKPFLPNEILAALKSPSQSSAGPV